MLVDVSRLDLRQAARRGEDATSTSSQTAEGDGNLQLITFAEKPQVVASRGRQPLSPAIKRHAGAGAGTDTQAAMQLAYGLYPDGYLPRMVIISDGNQTARRPRGRGLSRQGDRRQGLVAHVRSSDKTERGPRRRRHRARRHQGRPAVRGHRRGVVDRGAERDARAPAGRVPERRSSRRKTVELREGKNLIKFKSDAKHAGATTYKLRLAKVEQDTETKNNAAVMTAPVQGPAERPLRRGRRPARARQRRAISRSALEHENIDVAVRGPTRHPVATPRSSRSTTSCWSATSPRTSWAPARWPRSTPTSKAMGGGLIMAGGEDSFGSGGYERTTIENMMPVRFDSEKIKEQPDIALVPRDRPLGLDAGPQARGREGVRARHRRGAVAQRLHRASSRSTARRRSTCGRTRAANRMRISNDIARLQSGGGTNIYPGLKEAFEILQGINAKVKHVILLSDGEAPTDGIAELVRTCARRASRCRASACRAPIATCSR